MISKKYESILLIAITCSIFCFSVFLSACNYRQNMLSPFPTKSPTVAVTPTVSPEPSPKLSPTPYHPGGPDIMGLYINRNLVVDEYKTTWIKGKDIGVFYAYPTRNATVESLTYMELFKKYWNVFPNAAEYKIGYYLEFKLKSSETIRMTIRLPKDSPKDPNAYFYQFIEVYVYDNLNRIPGPTFYHLEESSTYEETIMTSIKLTAGTSFEEVETASLSAFVFNSDDDFDPVTEEYIGQTIYKIEVLKN